MSGAGGPHAALLELANAERDVRERHCNDGAQQPDDDDGEEDHVLKLATAVER